MGLFAGALIPWIEQRFFTTTGVPLASGLIDTFAAGTSTLLFTKTDAALSINHTNPIVLGADGRPPSPIFLTATGYKFVVKNSLGVVQYTIDNIESLGQVFASTFGMLQSAGGKNQVSGYIVTTTDRLVTMNSTGGPTPCVVNLPAAASYASLLVIKNMGTIALSIVPNGANTIDSLAAAFALAASASPLFRTVMLISDGVSAWYVLAGHGT